MKTIVAIFCVAAIVACSAAPAPEANPDVVLDHTGLVYNDLPIYPHHLRYPVHDYINPYYRTYHPYDIVPRVLPSISPYFEPTLGKFVFPVDFNKDKKEEMKKEE